MRILALAFGCLCICSGCVSNEWTSQGPMMGREKGYLSTPMGAVGE